LARNIKNRELARLADDERPQTKEQLIEFFERTIWPNFPAEVLGKALKKREREKILGYGPHGV
jgi:antitoxin VapB